MPLTAQQTRLAVTIDTHVTHILATGGGDEAVLQSLADHMGTFKQLMDMSTGEEMNTPPREEAQHHERQVPSVPGQDWPPSADA